MKRTKWIGMGGTALLHLLVALLLWLLVIHQPEAQEEGGVPVMLGEVPQSQGDADPYTLTDVDVMPAEAEAEAPEATTPPAPTPVPAPQQSLISQTEEKTVEVKKTEKNPSKTPAKTTPVKETPKKPAPTPAKETPKRVDDTANKAADEAARKTAEAKKAAEAKAAAEARAAAEKAAAEKAAAEAASKRVAGAFGKGTQMGSKGTGTTGTGIEGSVNGNSATGKSTGVGGKGNSFSLSGRSLGKGGLPNPVYNVQEEGTVVVAITVNPAGEVISASVQLKGTSTSSAALRKAAVDAAKKARFNQVESTGNQTGTITYCFKLN